MLPELTASSKKDIKAIEAAPSAEVLQPTGPTVGDHLSPEAQEQLAAYVAAVENEPVEPEVAAPVAKLGETALSDTATTSGLEVKPEAESTPKAPEVKPTPPKRAPASRHADQHHQNQQQPSVRAEINSLTKELEGARLAQDTREHRRVQYDPQVGSIQRVATEQHAEPMQPAATHPDRRAAKPVAAEPKPQSRQEFVKQQEEVWGARDKVDTQAVPEGEMTWEQYLAHRPKGNAGDTYHIRDVNGKERILDVTTGKQVGAEQRIAGELTREQENPQNYYAVQEQKREVEREKLIRSNVEGAIITQKNPRLRGLLALGQEMNALYNSKERDADHEKNVKADFEARKATFEDMLSLYQDKGLDERALMYIADTAHGVADNPNFIPVEGNASYKGDTVKVVDFIENPKAEGNEHKMAYIIEHEDGTTETVDAYEVQFKREFPVPEVEKESPFQRVKKWFKNEGKKLRQYGGKAYLGNLWDRAATAAEDKLSGTKVGRWLTERHITDGMTPEQVQAQKLRNRRNNILGLVVVTGATILASRMGGILVGTSLEGHGFGDAMPPHPGADSFSNDTLHHLKEVGGTPGVQHLPLEGAPTNPETITTPVDLGVNDPSYAISHNEGGLQLFAARGLSSQQWYENAHKLYELSPQDFYLDNGDVRMAHSGELSLQARQFIESLRG